MKDLTIKEAMPPKYDPAAMKRALDDIIFLTESCADPRTVADAIGRIAWEGIGAENSARTPEDDALIATLRDMLAEDDDEDEEGVSYTDDPIMRSFAQDPWDLG